MIGTILAQYRITSRLGAGGMGEVYRATDTKLGRDVALKLLPDAFAADLDRRARFEREAKVLAALNHPCIAHVYGFESATLPDGTVAHLLAMEFVPGEDLAERLKRGPVSVEDALPIARQVAEALEEAHEKGIVHRDLKPANVKVTPDGRVKVLDFGLAKALVGDAETRSAPDVSQSPTLARTGTQAGVILGTAAYMSPEQARGKAVDKRADIWAFGVLLFEMLTGRRLFARETVSETLAAVLTHEPDWSALPSATPASTRALVRRCLDRDPRNRLRDIGEARVALDRDGAGGLDDDAGAGQRRRSAWLPVLGVAALAALLTAGAFRLLAPSPRPPALRKLDLVVPDFDLHWNIGPTLSPDGARVAYSAGNRVWVRDLDQLEAREVAQVSAPTPLGWSPDSQALVINDLKKLWTVAARGGARVAVADVPGTGQIVGVAWSESGQIALAVWRGGMYKVPAGGGIPSLLFDVDPARQVDFHYPSWLSNGDLFYLIHWKDGSSGGESPPRLLAVYDGAKQIPLAIDVGGARSWPTLTREGLLLYERAGENAGIWAVPYDVRWRRATGEAFLVGPAGFSVSASAEGSLLYVPQASTEAVNEMTWLDRSGKAIEVVGPGRVGLSHPTLSPDGRRIAFVAGPSRNGDIWVHDLEQDTETRLTFGGEDEWGPAWLPPMRVAYVQVASSFVSGRILAVKADGSGQPQMVVSEATLGAAPRALAVAPDRRTVLQIVDDRGHGHLRVGELQADGRLGPVRPILRIEPEPDVAEACVSPDGRLLAYVTDNPGQPELFLTRFPSGEGRWQVTNVAARAPRWAPETSELFFTAGPRNDELFAARVDPTRDPPLGAVGFLFRFSTPHRSSGGPGSDYNDYDVAADGRRLLVVRPAAGARAKRMVLVQNWLAEFRRPEVH